MGHRAIGSSAELMRVSRASSRREQEAVQALGAARVGRTDFARGYRGKAARDALREDR